MKKTVFLLLLILSISICLNLFQWRNQAVKCENLDSYWKAELLYRLWHKSLDGDKDWIPCEHLSPNCLKLDNKSE